MRYEIIEHETDVEIQVSDAAGRTPQVLQSMQDCRAGDAAAQPTNTIGSRGWM